MKRLMMLAALLAMALMAAAPAALAQGGQGFEEESESGDVEAEFATTNEGGSSNACAPSLQFGDSGNLQNEQGALQDESAADDIGAGGSSAAFGPSNETECEQEIQQSAAASSTKAPPSAPA